MFVCKMYLQLAKRLLEVSFYGFPYMLYVFPSIIIYIKLMTFISERPVIKGLNHHKEKVGRSVHNGMG